MSKVTVCYLIRVSNDRRKLSHSVVLLHVMKISGIMKWSPKKVVEFINIYKEKSVLWNPRDPNYFNRLKKNDAWEEIARDTGRSVEHCKRKMEYLHSALRREKMKIKRSMGIAKSADDIYKSTWFAFDKLKFLLNRRAPRRTSNTVENNIIVKCKESEDKNEEAVNDSDQNVEGNTESTLIPSQTTASPVIRKRKTIWEDRRLNKTIKILKTNNQTIQDDCQHFGNLVAAKLRKFNEDVRTNLESDIMGLFVKANKGFYNPSNYFQQQMLVTHQANHSKPEIYLSPE